MRGGEILKWVQRQHDSNMTDIDHLLSNVSLATDAQRLDNFTLLDQISIFINGDCYRNLAFAAEHSTGYHDPARATSPPDRIAVEDALFHLANALFVISYLAPTSR